MANTMLYTWGIVAAIIQITSAQQQLPTAVAEVCRRPPPSVDRAIECCAMPPLIPEEDYNQCNFRKTDTPRGPPGPLECEKHMCILQKNNLTRSNGKIDPVSSNDFFEKWATSTTDPASFKEAINIAKDRCSSEAQGPNPSPCPAARFLMCSSSVIFMKCPKSAWSTSYSCKELRDFFDQCSDVLIKYF